MKEMTLPARGDKRDGGAVSAFENPSLGLCAKGVEAIWSFNIEPSPDSSSCYSYSTFIMKAVYEL